MGRFRGNCSRVASKGKGSDNCGVSRCCCLCSTGGGLLNGVFCVGSGVGFSIIPAACLCVAGSRGNNRDFNTPGLVGLGGTSRTFCKINPNEKVYASGNALVFSTCMYSIGTNARRTSFVCSASNKDA